MTRAACRFARSESRRCSRTVIFGALRCAVSGRVVRIDAPTVDNASVANLEHVSILKQGVDEWNRWRKENPNDIADLSEANLSEANLSMADLSNADLSEADL